MLASCRPLQACLGRSQIACASNIDIFQIRFISQVCLKYNNTSVFASNISTLDSSKSLLCKHENQQRILWTPHSRHFSVGHDAMQKLKPKETKEIVESTEKPFSELTTAQKVKRVGTDATYTGVIIFGLGVTGLMVYAIGRELLSGQSPSGIYSRALKLCRNHEELYCAIGSPIKGRGEMNRRGRSRYVSHGEYEKDGVKHMRMQFYVEGPDGKGTAHVEVKQNAGGKYEFRYIFVELDGPYPRTFIIEDNR